MARLKVPPELAPLVRKFAADFDAVTARWMAEGWHTADEVEVWRVEARKIIQSGSNSNSDVIDMCRSWRGMAQKILGR